MFPSALEDLQGQRKEKEKCFFLYVVIPKGCIIIYYINTLLYVWITEAVLK